MRLKAMMKRTRPSRSWMGRPVSKPNCCSAPFPVRSCSNTQKDECQTIVTVLFSWAWACSARQT